MKIEKALVVDDSKVAHLTLNKLLRERGIEVDWAGSGEDGVAYLKKQKSNVVFMDVMMPGMDGFETTLAINNDPSSFKPPIVMCSANATDEDKAIAKKNGAVGFLSKPYTPDELDQILDMVRQMEDPAEPEAAAVAEEELSLDEPVGLMEDEGAVIDDPTLAPPVPESSGSPSGLTSKEVSDIARKVATQAAQTATERTAREVANQVARKLFEESSHKLGQEVQAAAVESAKTVTKQGLQQVAKRVSQQLDDNLRKEMAKIDQQVAQHVKQSLASPEFKKQISQLVQEAAKPVVEPMAKKIAQQAAEETARQIAQSAAKQEAEQVALSVAEEISSGAVKGANGRANIALIVAVIALVAAIALKFVDLPI